MIIYKAINNINGKTYIGLTTTSLKKRISAHISSKDGSYFHNSLTKHGSDKFDWEVLCECNSKEELTQKEIYYISKYNTFIGDGYNLTAGGEGTNGVCGENHWLYHKPSHLHPWYGRKHTEETKQKIRENMPDMTGSNNPFFGRKHTEETKQKISDIGKIACKGELNGMYGKKHSEETKRKISQSRKGKVFTFKTYEIILPSNETIIVDGLKGFCRDNDLSYIYARKCMNENRSYKGYYIKEVSV